MTLDERFPSKVTKHVKSLRCLSCESDTIYNCGEPQPDNCFWCGTRLPRIPVYEVPVENNNSA